MVIDWWNDYYGPILAAIIIFHLIAIAVDTMLVIGVIRESRYLMLPWLILSMIGIIFMGLGLLASLILLLVEKTLTSSPLVWQLVLLLSGSQTLIRLFRKLRIQY